MILSICCNAAWDDVHLVRNLTEWHNDPVCVTDLPQNSLKRDCNVIFLFFLLKELHTTKDTSFSIQLDLIVTLSLLTARFLKLLPDFTDDL